MLFFTKKPHKQLSDSSTALKDVKYFPKTETLSVIFHNNKEYLYEGFTKQDWKKLQLSTSKGRYFVHNIKNHFVCYKKV